MLLDIEPEVFTSGDRLAVIGLLSLAASDRHEWRPGLLAAVSAERFVEHEVPALKEFVAKSLKDAASPVSRRAVAKVTVGELKALLADLSKPAVLVVENRIGDGGFVQAVALALGDQRVVDALTLDRGWLRLSHGGGSGDMPELAADERAAFSVLVRVAVMFDGDRAGPGARSKNHDRVGMCRAAGVTEVHLLAMHAMENYAPLPVWEHHFIYRPERVEAIRRLPVEERPYRHFKNWFKSEGWHGVPKRVFPEDLPLTEADFAELGPDVVAELRELLAMIHRIL